MAGGLRTGAASPRKAAAGSPSLRKRKMTCCFTTDREGESSSPRDQPVSLVSVPVQLVLEKSGWYQYMIFVGVTSINPRL
jgi:hypothetical protein